MFLKSGRIYSHAECFYIFYIYESCIHTYIVHTTSNRTKLLLGGVLGV